MPLYDFEAQSLSSFAIKKNSVHQNEAQKLCLNKSQKVGRVIPLSLESHVELINIFEEKKDPSFAF